MRYEIYTNGFFFFFRVISYLNERNVSNIRLSLDGTSNEIHDSFRNCKGSFEKVIEATKLLKLHNIPFEINTMIHKRNNSIVDFQKFVTDNIGDVHVVYDYILNMGNAVENYEEVGVDIEEYCDAYVEFYRKRLNEGLKFDVNSKRFCGIGYDFLYITATGLMKICSSVGDKENIGNIFKEGIEECWLSNSAQCYKNIQCENYSMCQYKEVCKGGCRSRGQILGEKNTLSSPDVIYCNIFSKLFSNSSETMKKAIE